MKRIVLILMSLCMVISLCACGNVDTVQPNSVQTQSTETAVIPEAVSTPEDKESTSNVDIDYSEHSFEVHYINVGQADAALVLCDDKSMLIDGGNAADSDLIYTYLKNQNITELDYIICSHAHEDHVGGLSAPLATLTVGNVYAPKTESDIKAYQNFKKKASEQNLTIKNPAPGSSIPFGSSTVEFFGPITENADDQNNNSIVMKIIYGDTSFLFTGDAEREEEQEILSAGYDLSATVLKVGHHGSANSTTYPFLREVMPKYAVISVGSGNSYGHPTEDTLSRLRDAEVAVYRTDLQGDIIVKSDGQNVSVTTQKNKNAKTNPTVKPKSEQPRESVDYSQNAQTYIGNKNTKKFHYPSCYSLPKEKNRVYLSSREEAISDGFSPCGNCNP